MSDDVKKTELPTEKTTAVDTQQTQTLTENSISSPSAAKKDPKFKKKLGKSKKKKRRRIIIAIVVLLLLGLLFMWWRGMSHGGQPEVDPKAIFSGDIINVERQDVTKTVSLSGTLQSAKSVSLYSTLNSAVSEVKVKVGDQVTQGQHLASMDTKPVNDELNSQVSALQETQVGSQNQVIEAQENLEKAQRNIQNNTNPEIVAAEKALRAANEEYMKTQRSFKELKETKAAGIMDALLQQEAAVRAAYHDVENAELDYAKIGVLIKEADRSRNIEIISIQADQEDLKLRKKELEDVRKRTDLKPEDKKSMIDEISKAIKQLEATLEESESNLEASGQAQVAQWSQSQEASTRLAQAKDKMGLARREYRAALHKIDTQLAESQDQVAKAQDEVSSAKVSLQEAKIEAEQQLKQLQRGLQQAQAAANAGAAKGQQAIAKLRADIGSARVTSPMNGIVTEISAKVGSAPQGALLTVEDNQNLVIKTAVKEKEVTKVAVGQQVTFKTPATGDKEYTGTVSFISPAAASTASADPGTNPGGDGGSGQSGVTFPVEIKVTGDISGLRLGSTAKAKVIVTGATNALAVPSGALLEGPMPIGDEGGAAAIDSGDSAGAKSGPKVVVNPGAPQQVQEEAQDPKIAGASTAATSDANTPKSVLVLENASSKTPKVKEVPVKVLVDAGGMVAIEGEGITGATKVLNNATRYLHLAGDTGIVSDTDPFAMDSDEMPQG